MKNLFQDKKIIVKKTIVFILILLCSVSIIWFIATIKNFHKKGELTIDYSLRKGYPTRLRHTINLNTIKTWMTFDYINVIFKLPKMYLRDTLNINDPRYPNIRIDNYTRHNNIDSSMFLNKIEQVITNYSMTK